MRTYEAVMVFDPALEVEQIENDLRKLNEQMSAGGTVRRWERWGKRRLAYEIKGRQYGYYVLAVFDQEPAAVAELDRNMRINASVIRHLVSVLESGRAPEIDAESVRTLGAAPESVAAPASEIVEPDEILIENGDVIPPESEAAEEPNNIV
jgi:small subunit ribosomal protein S6